MESTSAIHPAITKNMEDLLVKLTPHISMRKSHNASMLNSFHNNIAVRSVMLPNCYDLIHRLPRFWPSVTPRATWGGGWGHSHCIVQLRAIMVGKLICLLCTPKPTGTNRLKQKTDNCITESGNILYFCVSFFKKKMLQVIKRHCWKW